MPNYIPQIDAAFAAIAIGQTAMAKTILASCPKAYFDHTHPGSIALCYAPICYLPVFLQVCIDAGQPVTEILTSRTYQSEIAWLSHYSAVEEVAKNKPQFLIDILINGFYEEQLYPAKFCERFPGEEFETYLEYIPSGAVEPLLKAAKAVHQDSGDTWAERFTNIANALNAAGASSQMPTLERVLEQLSELKASAQAINDFKKAAGI